MLCNADDDMIQILVTITSGMLHERTRCISGEASEKDFLKVAAYEIPPIQAVGSDEGF